MNPKTKKYLLIGGAVVAVGVAIWWFYGRKGAKSGNQSKSGGLSIKPVSGRFKKAVSKSGLKSKIGKAPVVQTQPEATEQP